MFGKTTKLFEIKSIQFNKQWAGYKIKPVKDALKYIEYQITRVSHKLIFELKEISEEYIYIEIPGPKKLINKAVHNILFKDEKFLRYFEWSEI